MIVLSHFQASILLKAKGRAPSVHVSPDLGLSQVEVLLGSDVVFPGGEMLSWEMASRIADNQNNCFVVDDGDLRVIQVYSEVYERAYTLYPTESAPTMLVSGIPMHRIKGTTPWQDTQYKIKAFGRVGGHILDTTTGLGYTAIMAAANAEKVTTVELDPSVLKISKLNPWSQALFDNPKIDQKIGDSFEWIETFEKGVFSGIIHDPPMLNLAGALYSLEFYQEAYRVLKPNGRMFHYVGNPKSKSGSSVTRGVVNRLKAAGFPHVVSKPGAFGVVAFKLRKIA